MKQAVLKSIVSACALSIATAAAVGPNRSAPVTRKLSKELIGKTALVTGASSGLGAHFASVLADAHANLTLAARRTEAPEEIAAAIRKKGLGTAVTLKLDVTRLRIGRGGFRNDHFFGCPCKQCRCGP